jgi:hypothetical protein
MRVALIGNLLALGTMAATGCSTAAPRSVGWEAHRVMRVETQTYSGGGLLWSDNSTRSFYDAELVRFTKNNGDDCEAIIGPARSGQAGDAKHRRKPGRSANDDDIDVFLGGGWVYLPGEQPSVGTDYVGSAHVTSVHPALGTLVVEVVDANTHRVYLLVDHEATHRVNFDVDGQAHHLEADHDRYADVVKIGNRFSVTEHDVTDSGTRDFLRQIRAIADYCAIK